MIKIFKFPLWIGFITQSFNAFLFSMSGDGDRFAQRFLIAIVSVGFLGIIELFEEK